MILIEDLRRPAVDGRTAVLVSAVLFDALNVPQDIVARDRTAPLSDFGGFLALSPPHAAELQQALTVRGVHADARGSYLRLGPASYLSDTQVEAATTAFGAPVKELFDH